MTRKSDPQTYAIIGAAMAVHRELGPGFLEDVYHEALAIEFSTQGIPYLHEVELALSYKGHALRKTYRADFVCNENIIVELKALSQITGTEKAQVINYLKAANFDRGLLLNFGAKSLQYERLAKTIK
ncbi:MAG: GxxExxY protein [Anaerolineaceae bacterium]|nr:MAG: GxxExxY protein [Anaerolineaceae bacterium]